MIQRSDREGFCRRDEFLKCLEGGKVHRLMKETSHFKQREWFTLKVRDENAAHTVCNEENKSLGFQD